MHKKHSSFRDFIKSKIEAKSKKEGSTSDSDSKGEETSRERKGGLYGKKMSYSKKKHGMKPGHKSSGARRDYKKKMKRERNK